MRLPPSGLVAAALLALAARSPAAAAKHTRNYDAHDYYAVHLRPDILPESISSHLGLHYEGPLGELQDHHIFRATDRTHNYDHIQTQLADLKWRRRKREAGTHLPHPLDHVLLSQKQELHKRFPLVKRGGPLTLDPRQSMPVDALLQQNKDIAASLGINDPIFLDQWHLFNHVQPGHDINVTGLWQQGITGANSTVCIVDDGLDMDSDDLHDNYFRAGSYDFNDQVEDPKPRLSDDRHGTRCAGEVAAARNNVCGVGIAYDGKVSGVRILSKVISDADEAVAMNYAFQENQIYSCSWGPPDDGQSMEAPGILIQRAFLTGVQKGRAGLGSIYVFAIGNGAANDDNCNFDGYTNSIYSVSVGGIDRQGLHPYYSEKCSAQLVVTYSSGSGDAIHTTDVGKNTCYSNHGGTSAAGPLVAGIYALMLQVNPLLSWRDIQWLTVLAAVRLDQPSDWQTNKAVGKDFSHQFGYGKADAGALVDMARTWVSVKPQAWYFSPWLHVRHPVPQGEQGLASSFTVTQEMLHEANLERLEHVTVTMNVEHTRRGDLSAELRSPSGMVSQIATARANDEAPAGFVDWTFMSVAHWGESGVGEWTVVLRDEVVNDHEGVWTDWRLRLWGESRDAGAQALLPMPTESDDDGHDDAEVPVVGTTSVGPPSTPATGMPQGNPDDHQHRPVNSKISASPTPSPPTGTGTPGDKAEQGDDSDTPSPSASPTTNFLPHPFPSFGTSKRTQIWIYGALALILTFLAVLGGWCCWMRRRRRGWKAADEYGFEMVDREDDGDGEGGVGETGVLVGGGGYRGKGRRGGRRAGELYDAFAEGSDEEVFGLEGESEGEEEEEEGEEKGRVPGNGRYRDEETPLTMKEGSGAR